MKKLLTFAFFALLSCALWASSPNTRPANPFHDDLSCLDNDVAGMTQLEQLVEERNATYTQLALEHSSLLNAVSSNHQDISDSLLGAGGKMDETLKIVLIVLAILAVLAIGCCLAIAVWSDSWYWY